MSASSSRALQLGRRYFLSPRNFPHSTNAGRSQRAPSTTRYFSTEKQEKGSLRDAVNRIENEGKENSEQTASPSSSDTSDIFRKAVDFFENVQSEVSKTWQDLVKSGGPKDINKKVRPTETVEGSKEYTGAVEIMIIDPSENLTAWQKMQKRLSDAPIIQSILGTTEEMFEKSGAKRVKEKVDHLREDAQEAWETSQNPWVYRVSSVYDTMTAESEYAVAVRELRKLDPDFTLEEWKEDVVEHTLPQIMKWLLEGKINQLKPWLSEGVFKRIAAEITARKQEGVQVDTHVLAIMNSEILAIEPDDVEKGSPLILLHFMCQQINCVRKKDGSVVEGSEDDIRANSYVAAFQREYNVEKGELNWKIVDFRFNGAIAYL